MYRDSKYITIPLDTYANIVIKGCQLTDDGDYVMIFTGTVIKILKISLIKPQLNIDFELQNVNSDINIYGFKGIYRYIIYSAVTNTQTLSIITGG